MKTIVDENKPQYQFELGDFFVEKDYKDTHFLTVFHDGYYLISLETGAASFVCKDADMIQIYLKHKVESGALMYYSKEDYCLEPQKKDDFNGSSNASLSSGDLFEGINNNKREFYMLCSFNGLFALVSLTEPGVLYYSGFATFEAIEIAIKNDGVLLNSLAYYSLENYYLKLTNIAI